MLLKLLFVLMLGFSALLCVGCDGAIRVKTKVYAQTSSFGDSRGFVDEPTQLEPNLKAVKDVNVTLYHGGDYSPEKTIDKSTLWQSSGKTGPEGEIELGGTTSPYRFHAALVVDKAGYKPVTKIFLHDKLAAHEAIIILVPNDAKDIEKQKLKN